MDWNDGSQYRVVTDPAAQLSQRELFGFRAASARNGVPYEDTAYRQHRETLSGMSGLLIYQFVWENAGPPEAQAEFLLGLLGGALRANEMVMIDIEAAGLIADPVAFLRRWCAVVEPVLDTRTWVYVPGALAPRLTRQVTQDRLVMAPRYSGTPQRGAAPTWPHDVHQYTDQGPFPGCTQSGDTSFTPLSVQQMLTRCNPNGTNAPFHTEGRTP